MNLSEDLQKHMEEFQFQIQKIGETGEEEEIPSKDLELPTCIINNFSKLFRLWSENPILKKSIKSELFYDVFSEMFHTYNYQTESLITDNTVEESSSEFECLAVCEICDQHFNMICDGDIVNAAYAEHKKSPTHIEMMKTFNKIRDISLESPVVDFDLKNEIKDEELVSNNSKSLLYGKYITTHENGTEFHCECCRCVLSQKEINRHLLKEGHLYQMWLEEEGKQILKNHANYVKISHNTLKFVCYLCNVKDIKYRLLGEHCNSQNHLKCIDRISSEKSVLQNVLFSNGNEWHCKACDIKIPSGDVKMHEESNYHKDWIKYLSVILLLEEPYIHKLRNTLNIYICYLCGVEFKSITKLVSHCESQRHKEYRKIAIHVRKDFEPPLSRIQSRSTSEIDLITNFKGAPYCKLCSKNLKNKNNIESHLKGSFHIQRLKKKKNSKKEIA